MCHHEYGILEARERSQDTLDLGHSNRCLSRSKFFSIAPPYLHPCYYYSIYYTQLSVSGTLRKNRSLATPQKNSCEGLLVELQLSNDQIATMAPDASSLSAGKKLSNAKHWKTLGQSSTALWGECQGSALYQVKIDLTALAVQCSCPSRKQPCKHGLGLLLLAVNTPAAIPEAEQPEWITSWLSKRSTSQKRKEAREAAPPKTTPSASSARTAEKRLTQVKAGIEQLDLWLNDLVRNGLGNLGSQPGTFWENEAAQMVDAQAPAIATRIRRMAQIPNAWSNWPERLLTQLGKLALLTQAFQNIDQLDPALQDEVRQLVGWALKEEEVITRGEHVTDDWLFLGQQIEDRDRGRTQNTWLFGLSSKRAAMISQF